MNFDYTVAVCSYNMEQTVEKSLRSILDLTTDNFEILVVDGGSSDGSLKILRNLSNEFGRLRVIITSDHNSGGLAADRNVGVYEARGNYVLMQLDVDDYYYRGIMDFVNVFEQLESEVDGDFYLKGRSINIGEKEFLKNFGPYRYGLTRGEDRDLWRRLLISNSIIWLQHQPVCYSIGYEPDRLERIQQEYQRHISDFRSGVTLSSFIRWCFKNMSLSGFGLNTFLGIIAFLYANHQGIYGLPEEYSEMDFLPKAIAEQSWTLAELESELGISIDKATLSREGIEVFYDI